MKIKCPICTKDIHTYQLIYPTGKYVKEGFNLSPLKEYSGPYYFAAHKCYMDHRVAKK